MSLSSSSSSSSLYLLSTTASERAILSQAAADALTSALAAVSITNTPSATGTLTSALAAVSITNTPSVTDAPLPYNTFTSLPYEVQVMIWNDAVVEPAATIHLCDIYHADFPYSVTRYEDITPTWTRTGLADPIPNILQATQLSRQVAQQRYSLRFGGINGDAAYFDPTVDTVSVQEKLLWILYQHSLVSRPYLPSTPRLSTLNWIDQDTIDERTVLEWPLLNPNPLIQDFSLVRHLVVYKIDKITMSGPEYDNDLWHNVAHFRPFTALERVTYLIHPGNWSHQRDPIDYNASFADLWVKFVNPQRAALGLPPNPTPIIYMSTTGDTGMFKYYFGLG